MLAMLVQPKVMVLADWTVEQWEVESLKASEWQVSEQAQLGVALSAFQELLQVHQAIGNLGDIAFVNLRLGDIYQQLDEFERSLNCYHQALGHYQTTQDWLMSAKVLSHIGKAHERQGWLTGALNYYEQALAKLSQNPNSLSEATTVSHLATLIEDMF
jgi:tetratricopeptide (TPR) repeat protein